MTEENVKGESLLAAIGEETQSDLQKANSDSLSQVDPLLSGVQQPVKMEGVADKENKIYGEKQSLEQKTEPAAPVAAPKQQIAPVSANGENTSSRESPKTEMPVETPQVSQTAGVSENSNPSADEASPSVQETPVPSTEETEVVVSFEDMTPLEQANSLLGEIPGRMRLY